MFSKQELEVIRRVAQAVVTEIAPAEKPYFQVVWEEFLVQGLAWAGTKEWGIPAGLFIDGHAKLKLKSPLIDWIVAQVYVEVKQNFGTPEKEAMRKATIAAAACLGTPKEFAQKLGEQIPAKFLAEFDSILRGSAAQSDSYHGTYSSTAPGQVPECVAWYREPDDDRLKRCVGSGEKLQAQFFSLRRRRFTIFVNCLERGVWLPDRDSPVRLPPTAQYLLVVLLLHRGQPVPSERAARYAWPGGSTIINEGYKRIRSNLKGPLAILRDELESVKSIKIPTVRRGEDYVCLGNFTFCILLPGSMDAHLKTVGLCPKVP